MINIILVLLVIHYLGLYLFKPKFNTLNCGLFGWAGDIPKSFNSDKFKILGILNVERGKNSCGVSFDGDIQIGINNDKLFYDFAINRKIEPVHFPVVIGHTRNSSVGVVNEYNAHPFGFGNNNNNFEFIGAHNGTLKNYEDLAKKYSVEKFSEIINNQAGNVKDSKFREKIDSEILLEIIYKNKNFKVLNDYVGGAALVFTNTNIPNVIYLFKGKSKEFENSQIETLERPLYVYLENNNSMYFSSIEDSLKIIGGDEKSIINIEANVVYEITNGDFKNSKLTHISRLNSTQNTAYNIYEYNSWVNTNYNKIYKHATSNLGKKEKEEEESSKIISLPPLNKEIDNNIYKEKTIKNQNSYLGIPYFNKLRFFRNGSLINGVYLWIPHYGYYYLADSEKDANTIFNNQIVNNVFDGFDFLKKDDYNNGKVPFYKKPSFFYFVEGCQIKTYLDYSIFYEKYYNLKKNETLDYIKLSHVTTHPVIDINKKDFKNFNFQNICKDGFLYTGNFTILGAEKNYEIIKGNLESTKVNDYCSIYNKDYYKIIDHDTFENFLEKEITFSETLNNNFDEEEILMEMIIKEEEELQIIKDICEEDFTETIKDFQKIKNKLIQFQDNMLASKVVNFIDNSMKDIKNFIN